MSQENPPQNGIAEEGSKDKSTDGVASQSSSSVEPKESEGPNDGPGARRGLFGRRSAEKLPMSGRELGVWESSLEDRANIVSSWLLLYLTPLLQLGSRKVLDQEDLGVPSKQDRADRAFDSALAAWEEQTKKCNAINEKRQKAYEKKLEKCRNEEERKKVKPPKLAEPSIASALVKSFGGFSIIIAMTYYTISAFLTFVPVLILNDLVKYFQSQGRTEFKGYAPPWVEVVGLAVTPFLVSALQTRNMTILNHCAVFVRTAISTLLYRKSLRVSAAGRAKTSTGQVVNMMSNDATQLQRFLQFAGMIFVAPLQIILALVLVYRQVGNATWVGVGFMIVLAPINVFIFGIIAKMRRKVLKYSDLRVKMMNEILAGIRIIKFYAWERPFGKEVSRLRSKELRGLNWIAYVSAVGFSLILLSAPIIQPILVFLVYVSIQDKPLDAATAFTTVALFNILRFPFAFLPMGLLQYIQSKVSLHRIERYLALPELPEYVMSTPPPDADPSSVSAQVGSITISNGNFSWNDPDAEPIRSVNEEEEQAEKRRHERKERRKSQKNKDDNSLKQSVHSTVSSVPTEEGKAGNSITLQNVNVTIPARSLVAVVGSVGSGKSSLLSSILGEMETIDNSQVFIPRPEDHQDKAGFMSYCAQTPWIVNDTLRNNIIFGREFNQERYDEVIQACALLDDLNVLPAGDMTEIGERGINLSGGQKARVSLARALYSKETRIVLLDDPLSAVDAHVGEHLFSNAITGDVAAGKTRVLVTHHVHFLDRCDSVIVMERGRVKHQGKYQDLIAQGVDFAGAVDISKIQHSKEEESDEEEPDTTKKAKGPGAVEDNKADLKAKGEKLVKDEERKEGSVSGSAYLHYAKAGGLLNAFMVLIIQGLGRASEVMATFWLSFWAQEASNAAYEGNPLSKSRTNFYVGIYGLFGFLGVVGLTVRALIMANHRLNASKKLHDGLAESILRAPVSFFDVTPTGRILNRFSADMDKIDLQLTQSLSQGVTTIYSVLGALAAIIASTKGTFLIPLVPIGYLFFQIQKWFRKTSTELQRLNSIANSPIFADFSQTISGTSTIRAYGEEQRFFEHCKSSFDSMNTSYVILQLVSNWLALRLDFLGGLIGAFVAGVAVATTGFIPAGWLGLALSYAIEVTGYLKFGVRMIATIEADLTSVERILFYSTSIESEAPEFIPEADPDPNQWPTSGKIEFANTSMRYRDGPLVLKDISFAVKPGEKIGVVGRTGSGKSSLMVALFRINELENGGTIYIDQVDISKIGTATLRLNLSIIPQDPVIFSNTVRYNLDPFGSCTDDELWQVLKKVNMDEVVATLPNGLNEQVAEGGENFSQGQRQLICIARSLLRKPKILVLDEATASIDNKTDLLIQNMIRSNFSNATVLTIAHRLNTIMDSDRILVLDDGNVAEFDSPSVLLQKEDGIFRALVEKSRAAHGVVE